MSILSEKWSRAKGLGLDDIKDQSVKNNMAQLLENQMRELGGRGFLTEADTGMGGNFATGIGDGGNPAGESGIAIGAKPTGNLPAGGDNMGALAPMSFALLRRSFPALFANKVVGVQAMNGPVSLIMAQRYVYQGTKDEAGWDKVPSYAGFTGNFNGMTGVDAASAKIMASAAAQDPQIAEAWRLRAPIADANDGPVTDFGGDLNKYPELTVHMSRVPVLAKTRKLGASYSLEAVMDAKAVLNLDLEKELLSTIQYELVAEQDREIIARLKKVAQDEGNISTGNEEAGYIYEGSPFQTTMAYPNGGIAGLGIDLTTLDGESNKQQDAISCLITYIMGLANSIAVATHRSAGNFAIVSPGVATLLQCAGPIWNRVASAVNPLEATPEIGTLGENIKVYRDQYALEDYVLVGYKGSSNLDAGIFYAPYVTGLESRAVSAQNFAPRIGVMSRYAIVDNILGAGRYYRYAKVKIPASLFNKAEVDNTVASMFKPVGY